MVASYQAAMGMVRIAVEDTGPGVPKQHRGLLFSKYGQIAVRQGTGLGLCLALVNMLYFYSLHKNLPLFTLTNIFRACARL